MQVDALCLFMQLFFELEVVVLSSQSCKHRSSASLMKAQHKLIPRTTGHRAFKIVKRHKVCLCVQLWAKCRTSRFLLVVIYWNSAHIDDYVQRWHKDGVHILAQIVLWCMDAELDARDVRCLFMQLQT